MSHQKSLITNFFIALVLIASLSLPIYGAEEPCSFASGVSNVSVQLIDATPVAGDPTARREHVFVSEDLMDMIALDDDFTNGAEINPQIHVQIESPSIDGRKSSAVFTIAGVNEGFPFRHIQVYKKLSVDDKNSGEYKLFQDAARRDVDLSTNTYGVIIAVEARVNSIAVRQSTVTNISGDESSREFFCRKNSGNELTEQAILTTDNRVAVIAPHGGAVEAPTDEQAVALATRLDSEYGIDPSLWWTTGYWGREQTFQRWHTTATAIDPTSFPALDDLFDLPDNAAQRPFQYTVALHGYSSSNIGLILGGRANRLDQCLVAKRIQEELVATGRQSNAIGLRIHSVGFTQDITVPTPRPNNQPSYVPPDKFDGDSANNLVNRLSPNPSSDSGFGGLQLEQSTGLRDDQEILGADSLTLLDCVTRGLARALDELVNVGTPDDHCADLTP